MSRSGSARIRSAAVQAVELGHADVHEHDVGAAAPHDVDRGAPVARLADDASCRARRRGSRGSRCAAARWSSAMTTVIGRAGAAGSSPPGAASLGVLAARRPGRPPTALGDARAAAARPRALDRLGHRAARRPGARRRRRGSRRRRPRRRAGWRRSPACRRGRRRRRSARRRRGRRAARARRRRGGGALHVDRAAHGRDGAGERDHQPVAGRLDLAAAVLGDRGAQRVEVRRGAARRRASSPTRSKSDAEPTRSVNRIVTNSGSIAASIIAAARARVTPGGGRPSQVHPRG